MTDLRLRPYDPRLGRFLEVDPVEGGSANDYDYVNGDPVNDFDLGGTFGFKKFFKSVAKVARVVSIVPGPIGTVAGAVSIGASLAAGDLKGAAFGVAAMAGGALLGKALQNTSAMQLLGRLEAKAPLIGRESTLFGVGQGNGILNVAGNRIGWGKGPGHELIYRVGIRGSHVNTSLLRTGLKFS